MILRCAYALIWYDECVSKAFTYVWFFVLSYSVCLCAYSVAWHLSISINDGPYTCQRVYMINMRILHDLNIYYITIAGAIVFKQKSYLFNVVNLTILQCVSTRYGLLYWTNVPMFSLFVPILWLFTYLYIYLFTSLQFLWLLTMVKNCAHTMMLANIVRYWTSSVFNFVRYIVKRNDYVMELTILYLFE